MSTEKVPSWVVGILGGLIALGAPTWCFWVTQQLERINAELSSQTAWAERVAEINQHLGVHLRDPEIHLPAIRLIEQRIQILEKKMDGLEDPQCQMPSSRSLDMTSL